MRFIVVFTLGLFILYGGYWFVGSAAAERSVLAALEDLRTSGTTVEVADVTTRGFPSRFDTTLTEISLSDPETGWGWTAPFLQVFALSYVPNRVIVVWPDSQTAHFPGQLVTITGTGLRASAAVGADLSLPLSSATFEGGQTRLTSDLGWDVTFDHSLAAIRQATGENVSTSSFDVFAEVTNLRPPGPTDLPLVGQARLDGMVVLDRPLDRQAVGQSSAGVTEFAVRDLTLRWGSSMIDGTGRFLVDDLGQLDGTLSLGLTNWEQLIDHSTQAGLISPDMGGKIRFALGQMPQGDRFEITLTLSAGEMFLGPIPLGPISFGPVSRLR